MSRVSCACCGFPVEVATDKETFGVGFVDDDFNETTYVVCRECYNDNSPVDLAEMIEHELRAGKTLNVPIDTLKDGAWKERLKEECREAFKHLAEIDPDGWREALEDKVPLMFGTPMRGIDYSGDDYEQHQNKFLEVMNELILGPDAKDDDEVAEAFREYNKWVAKQNVKGPYIKYDLATQTFTTSMEMPITAN